MTATVRDLLAEAASTVDGVNCTPYYRQTAKPGEAMVRLDRINYPNAFGGLTTWQVYVFLPATQVAAEEWIDEHADALAEALSEVLIVQSVQPVQMTIDSGTTSALVVEGIRETGSE